jgi:hypothetical protein
MTNENPYQSPNACDADDPNRASRLRLHPLGLVICGVAAFFANALATKVPAGELRILSSPWLAVTMTLASISLFVLCVIFAEQCRRHNAQAHLMYLLAPVGMYAYYGWRVIAG